LEKVRFSTASFGKKTYWVVLASVLLITTTFSKAGWSQTNETNQQEIIGQVVQDWIRVGERQYDRCFYQQAEKSLLQALEYEQYMTDAEKEKINTLLEKVHAAAIERESILESVKAANELIEQDKLIEAKGSLENLIQSRFLTKEERELARETLGKVIQQLKDKENQIKELYNQSVEFYRSGEIEKAREGFLTLSKKGLTGLPAGETPEDYLVKIDNILAGETELSTPIETKVVETLQPPIESTQDELIDFSAEPLPEKIDTSIVDVATPATDESVDIEKVDRKTKVIRSYTKAVVDDAIAKAKNYLGWDEFNKASEVIGAAEQLVIKNQLYLGENLFNQYSVQLQQMTAVIVDGQFEKNQKSQRQRR